MGTPPGNVPRFVPTLTEVVQAPPPVAHDMVRALTQELGLLLERRLREETVRLHASLQLEIALRVQQAVAQALAVHPPGGNVEKTGS